MFSNLKVEGGYNITGPVHKLTVPVDTEAATIYSKLLVTIPAENWSVGAVTQRKAVFSHFPKKKWWSTITLPVPVSFWNATCFFTIYHRHSEIKEDKIRQSREENIVVGSVAEPEPPFFPGAGAAQKGRLRLRLQVHNS